jgi:hypothetical protein
VLNDTVHKTRRACFHLFMFVLFVLFMVYNKIHSAHLVHMLKESLDDKTVTVLLKAVVNQRAMASFSKSF